VTAEFDWWLLILGLVVGGGIVWLVLAELPRRDAEIDAAETELEAGWIAANLAALHHVEPETVAAVLREHRAYLRLPPPDEAVPGEDQPPTDTPITVPTP